MLFHELAHSVVAQRYKIKVLSITLFIFGGLARIGREPSKAIQEFNIAIAGPIASGILAGVFFLLTLAVPDSQMIGALGKYLSGTNALLAMFNLLPGFPLDGGRVLRAMVWGITKDFSRATRAAGASGKVIAYAMIAYGLYGAAAEARLGKNVVRVHRMVPAECGPGERRAGDHSRDAARSRAKDVMSQEVPTIPANMSLDEYSSEVLRTGRRVHLVTMDDRLVGLMNVSGLSTVPRDEWNMNSVQSIMVPRDRILWASPEEPLQRLLERLISADVNQMPVVSHDGDGAANIVGIVTREAILRVIQTRSEFGTALASR